MRHLFARYSQEKRRYLLPQSLLLGLVVALIFVMANNMFANLSTQGIAGGFGFLSEPAGFSIIQSLIPYSPQSSYARVFLVGLCNTLLVSALAIVLATILGFAIGIARLSTNWLLRQCAGIYVELVRNIPLLLQIFFWYFAVLRALPLPHDSLHIGDVIFLNNRGLYLPSFELPFHFNLPELGRFNFSGGIVILPEFIALLLALSTYTAAFIGEIVRGGILAIDRGQTQAAHALGLKRGLVLRLVIIPQALRVIIPPLTNQYLNLTKNSSLAVAIAYPDLVSVFAGTALNQTGQAVEIIALTLAVYLTLSLSMSFAMNRYEARLSLSGRRS